MPVVMGTAGHIDHGKTSLVRALTGIDCDRLDEEKRRGITIELGFAELELPSPGAEGGKRAVSVIDVPGHERFVHTMVAGASGVDFVLLVIAADEGVMPQTREHLEICSLLGIRKGVVALTKIDAVDDELLELAKEDVSVFLQGSFLEGAPVIPVSAQSGRGLDTLVAALADLESSFAPARSQDLFRIPVDRIFTLRGHGTVITGTMISGSVSLGDAVRLYPGTRTSKVRGLQNHWGKLETAVAGRRTAVNLPDLAVEDVNRGDVVSHPGMLFPSERWLTWVSCLPSSPRALRHRAEIHLHHGSREIQARLYFFDRDRLQPGDSCLCEVRLPDSAVGVFGDRFVLRSFSPLQTVAGGVLLNPLGVSLRKRDKNFAERCAAMQQLVLPAYDAQARLDAAGDCVLAQLEYTRDPVQGCGFDALRVLTGLDSRVLEKALGVLMANRRAVCFDKSQRVYVAGRIFEGFMDSCIRTVAAHHERYPEKQGMNKNELLSGWGKAAPLKLAHAVIEQALKQGKLAAQDEFLRLPAHEASFSGSQALLGDSLLSAYKQAGFAPPTVNALLESLGVTLKQAAPLLASLRSSGRLVRISEDIWYASEHLEAIEKAIREWFGSHETLDVAGMKNITSLSRKHIIPLLEYFDAARLTIRVGDARILRAK